MDEQEIRDALHNGLTVCWVRDDFVVNYETQGNLRVYHDNEIRQKWVREIVDFNSSFFYIKK